MLGGLGKVRNTPSGRIKILYLDHAPLMGGAERSLLVLLRHLDRERFEPLLACPPDSTLAQEAAKLGVRIIPARMPVVRGVNNPLNLTLRLGMGATALARLIRRERVSIVHANVMRAAIYGALAARMSGARYVWHVRDIHRERLFVQAAGTLAHAIIVISRRVSTALPSRFASKTHLIYDGIDLEEFDPQLGDGLTFRRSLGLPEDALLVGNAAWIAPWKGQRAFIEAVGLVAQAHPQARFVIVGGLADPSHASYLEEIQARARELLGERLIFAGARSDMPQVMASLDVLAHSAQDEPLGLVLIEAMAMEVPVVAMASGGVPEIIAQGETGLLVPPGDVKALAQAISGLLGNREQGKRMGAKARQRALTLFEARQMTRRVEEVYLALSTLSEKGSRFA